MNRFIVFFSLMVLSASCAYDNEEDLYPQDPGQPTCNTLNLSYNVEIAPIINANCATSGCHDGNSGLRGLTNYAAVKTIVDAGAFENRVLIQKDMPPSQPLTNCELDQLQAWIDDGAKENR